MKNKSGFTLPEILIMLAIIGVITALSIAVVSTQQAKFGLNCYHLLRELQMTAGSIAAQTSEGNLFSKITEQTETTGSDGTVTSEETTKYDLSNDDDFCKLFASKLNSASKLECSEDKLFSATTTNIYFTTYNVTPTFRLINGYSFYLSKHIAGGVTSAGEYKPGYRMLAVDMNGDAKPNKADDDIIAFAIFDNGTVLPYGVAATNTRTDAEGNSEYVPYFQTVIKGKNLVPSTVVLEEANFLQRLEKSSVAWMFPSVIIKNPDNVAGNGLPRNLSFKDSYCKVYADQVAWYDPNYCTGYTSITNDWNLKILVSSSSAGADGTTTTTEEYKNYSVTKCGKYCGDSNDNCYDDADSWYAAHPNTEPTAIIDCSFNIIKPQVSRFIPVLQDVYAAHYGTTNENTTVNHNIYKW